MRLKRKSMRVKRYKIRVYTLTKTIVRWSCTASNARHFVFQTDSEWGEKKGFEKEERYQKKGNDRWQLADKPRPSRGETVCPRPESPANSDRNKGSNRLYLRLTRADKLSAFAVRFLHASCFDPFAPLLNPLRIVATTAARRKDEEKKYSRIYLSLFTRLICACLRVNLEIIRQLINDEYGNR